MDILAASAVICGSAALLCLTALHFASPEYQPSWRMISEYAMGKHKWLITTFFLLWGGSSILLAAALWPAATTTWAKVGLAFLVLSGIGEVMGGLFDVKHKLHGAAFMLGVPSLPVAALLLSYHLAGEPAWAGQSTLLIVLAHSTWASIVLMGAAMGVMMSGFKKAGIPMGPDMEPPKEVPPGVTALAGYANRLLVLLYIAWAVVAGALPLLATQ